MIPRAWAVLLAVVIPWLGTSVPGSAQLSPVAPKSRFHDQVAFRPALALDGRGRGLIVWSEAAGMVAQPVDLDLVPAGPEVVLTAGTAAPEIEIFGLPSGGFLLLERVSHETERALLASWLDVRGEVLAGPLRVAIDPELHAWDAALDEAGRLLVVWTQTIEAEHTTRVQVRGRALREGDFEGSEFGVSTVAPEAPGVYEPDLLFRSLGVVALTEGDFAVYWMATGFRGATLPHHRAVKGRIVSRQSPMGSGAEQWSGILTRYGVLVGAAAGSRELVLAWQDGQAVGTRLIDSSGNPRTSELRFPGRLSTVASAPGREEALIFYSVGFRPLVLHFDLEEATLGPPIRQPRSTINAAPIGDTDYLSVDGKRVQRLDGSGRPLGRPVDLGEASWECEGQAAIAGRPVVRGERLWLVWTNRKPHNPVPEEPRLCFFDEREVGVFARSAVLEPWPARGVPLAAGRFLVEGSFSHPQTGETLDMPGFPLSRDSAAFYFFNAANPELLVKILDGRSVNGHFWVDLAGLSTHGFEIVVTDRLTARARRYRSDPGSITTLADRRAFEDPDHAATEPGAGDSFASPGSLSSEPAVTSSAENGAPPCSVTTAPMHRRPGLCLLYGRHFEIEGTFVDPRTGEERAMRGSTIERLAGYLWFFREANAEIALKLVDGRDVNGAFWVFASSLTDLEYRVTVRDVGTGRTVVLDNVAGERAWFVDTETLSVP